MAGGPVKNDGQHNVRVPLVQHRICGLVLRHPAHFVRVELKYEIHIQIFIENVYPKSNYLN